VADCLNRVSGEGSGDLVIVVYDQEWHPGVVGLGASKVKDFFDRSAVVIGRDGKGSGRSVEGFNIGKAFIKAQEAGLLKKGGGHAAAGGLTVAPDRIAGFRAFINGEAKDFRRPPTKVDMAVPVGLLPRHVVEAFDLMAPFGMGNPRPRIALTGGVLADVRVLKGAHVKARLLGAGGEADLILFNGVGTALGGALQGAEGRFADVLGEIGLNSYGGVTKIQIKPEDAMIGAPASALAEAAH